MNDEPEARLIEAMRYAALDGGKRVRPYLTLATADMFNVKKERALQVAAAIELVHCYSLVHDDLPSMDDDDLRRGKPSCHNKFGEATAILAGDALLTKAFEVLSSASVHSDPNIRSDLVMALAKAAGHEGMVGGQMLDIIAESEILNTPETTRLQRMKTGMLIAVSCEVGAILGEASESAKNVLNAYAHNLGIAFQITDDLLDEEGNAKTVGKKTGKDKEAGKSTFVSLLGIDRARDQAKALVFEACEHLNFFGKKADPLKNMAQFVITRSA
ncbi:MAG: farnesyl-diphosphate synthase [Magnetovibrio sp.]|nr:farnesyl-diphosphate synthase [Magnetovibrio sp.]